MIDPKNITLIDIMEAVLGRELSWYQKELCKWVESMSQIVERIKEEIITFEMMSGKEPNAIYLGQTEHFALMAWHEAQGYQVGQPNRRLEKFMGIPVYKIVTENSHLGLGICQK